MSELTSNMGSTQEIGHPPGWPTSMENEGHDRLEQHLNGDNFETPEQQIGPNEENAADPDITSEKKLYNMQNGSPVMNQNGEENDENNREHIAGEQNDELEGPDSLEHDQVDTDSADKQEEAVASSPRDTANSIDNVNDDSNRGSEKVAMDAQRPGTTPAGDYESLPIATGHSSEQYGNTNGNKDSQNASDENDAPVLVDNPENQPILEEQALERSRDSSGLQDHAEDINDSENLPVVAATARNEQRLTENMEPAAENIPGDNSAASPAVNENQSADALPNDDNNENQPNQMHYAERNFGQEEEASMAGNSQNQDSEEQLLQGGRVPLRDISETMEHLDGRQQDEYEDEQDADRQNAQNRIDEDVGCFSQRPIGIPLSTRFAPITPRSRLPEDDIPGPSEYHPGRGRRPEDDIPGPSNPQPRKIAPWLLQNANRPHDTRRDPQDDIPGPSHSSSVYNGRREDAEVMNTSDSYQDEPIVGEELAQLLRIANVSRFQAGLPPAQKTPPYEYVYGGSPSPTNDGASTSGPSTSDQSSSSGPSTSQTYIDADFEFAKRLQEEENRRVRFEENNQQSSSSSRGYDPWKPSRYQPDDNDGDNEGDGVREIKIAPHINAEDAFLHKECMRLYSICRGRLPDVYVPEPMSIPNMHPWEFISGYKDVMSGGTFPFPETSEPPVPPGSPGPSEEAYRSTTVTTAYQVVQGPNGEKCLKKKLTLKIPRNIAFPTAKSQLKQDGGSSRKQAFQAERPTAFQNFVKATDAAMSRVPTKPLFSDDHYDEPGVPGPGPSSRESMRQQQEYMHRKRRLGALIDIESGEPGISSRRIEEEDDGMGDDMNEADDEPLGERRDGVFAVPAIPLKVGDAASSESSLAGHSSYKTSPAGQRRIYEQRRRKHERPRLSLQIPLNDHGEGTSSSGGHRSRSPIRRSGGSSVFSQDLMNRHSFLRRTDDEDSIFNTGTMADLRVDCGNEPCSTNTVSTQAAESNWPNIPWKDPEDMPSIDEIPEAELRKMPAEYVDAIIECQLGTDARPKQERQADEKKQLLEASYLQICRSYLETPCRVPREVLNTRFEIYIRFPFFQRPLYVQNVLVALQIPDNEGNVLARVPEKYLNMSFAEFFKEGVKVLFGLRLTDTPTNKAISNEQLEDSCVKYLQEVSSRWFSEVPSLPYDKQVEREIEINDQMNSLEAVPVSDSDLAEMERYRLHYLEEQKLSAQRQRMKVVGNSLSRFVPRNPALNRVRLADAVEVDDSVNTGMVRQPNREVRRDTEKEDGELDSDDDELTETQL